MRLHTKLQVVLLPLIVAPLGLMGWLAFDQLRSTSEERLFAQMDGSLEQISRNINANIETAVSNVRLFSNTTILAKYVLTEDPAERYALLLPVLTKEFRQYGKSYPQYKELRVLLPDGFEDVRWARLDLPNVAENEADSGYFRDLEAQPSGVLRRFFRNPDDQTISLIVVSPVILRDPTREPIGTKPRLRGYFALTVDLSMITDLVSENSIGETGSIFVVDSNGTVLFHKRPEAVGSRFQIRPSTDWPALSGSSALHRVEVSGAPHYVKAVELMPEVFLVAALPERDIFAAGDRLRSATALVIVTAIALTTILVMLVLRRLVVLPLLELRKTAREIGDGNLSPKVRLKRGDELGELATSLLDMAGKLSHTQNELLRQAEQLEQSRLRAEAANQAKSQFLAHMSHEIRTPINGVLGMAEVLSYTPLTVEQNRFVSAILRSGQLLTSIISDILDFSKIEAGKLEIRPETFDLRVLASDLYDLLSDSAAAKENVLTFDLPVDRSLVVVGDQIRIGQVLMNLLSNAIKFTERGQVRLRIAIEDQQHGAISLRFEVIDSGIGITQDRKDCIFDAFRQADSSTTRRYGGTGLGLSICKEIVERMGGEIVVDSQPGRGSTFSFGLNLPTASAEEITVPNGDRKHRKRSFSGNQPWGPLAGDIDMSCLRGRVLLAEDNPINLEVAQTMLENLGCTVDTATDGRLALDALAETRYDALLLDCEMPELNGYEVAREIRRQEKESGEENPLPIVAQTANAFEDDRDRCFAAGMDAFLSKPFSQEQLQVILLRWLSGEDETGPDEPRKRGTALQSGPDRDYIDGAALARIRNLRRDGGTDLLAKIIEDYLELAPSLLAEIEDALQRGEIDGLRKAAHRFKSCSANLGAVSLAEDLRALEIKCREGSLAGANDLVERIRQELIGVLDALRDEDRIADAVQSVA